MTQNLKKLSLCKQFLQCVLKYLWNVGIAKTRYLRYTKFRVKTRLRKAETGNNSD